MSVKKILIFPDHHLIQASRLVTRFDDNLKNLVNDLTETLYAGPGVGLAAPQIGVTERVSVINVTRASKKIHRTLHISHGYLVLINPILLQGEGLQIPREGCLSIPDLLGNVRRYQMVTVKSRDLEGGERIIKTNGFEALALQHEIDHLDGKLFLDRIMNTKTDIFRRINQ